MEKSLWGTAVQNNLQTPFCTAAGRPAALWVALLSASKVNEKILLCRLIDISGNARKRSLRRVCFHRCLTHSVATPYFPWRLGGHGRAHWKVAMRRPLTLRLVIAPDYVTSLSVCHYVRYKNQRAPVEVAAFGPCSVIFFVCPQRGVSVRGGRRGAVQKGFLARGGLCPGGGSQSRWGVSVQFGGLCPGGVGVLCLGGGGGFSVQGSLCQGDPRRVTCGRYASYWNAFLLIYLFSIFTKYDTKLIKKNKNRRPFHHFP